MVGMVAMVAMVAMVGKKVEVIGTIISKLLVGQCESNPQPGQLLLK